MNEEDQQRGGSGVLVVIPVNDCAPRLLTTTLDSLAVQSLDSDDYKVLFVENGPQSCKLLGLLSSISSIDGYQACSIERLSLPEPQSELHVRRLGAEFCASRYLLFLDPGDQIDSAFLEKSVLALNNCECAGWVNPVKQELLPIMRQVQPKMFSVLLALCKPVVSSGHMYRTQEWLSASRKTPSVIADVDLFGEWHVQIRLMGKGLWGYPLRDAVYIGERDTKPVSMLDTKRYMAGIYLTLRKNMAVLPLVIRAMSAFKREWRKGWGYKSKLNPGWVLDKIQAVALKRFGFGDVSASLGGKGILLAILFPEKFIHRLLTTNSNISLAEIHCEFFTKPNLDFSPTTYQPTGSNSVLFAHSHWAVGGSERVLLAWMRAVRPHVAGRIIDVCGRESKQGSGERSEEGNAYYHQGVRDEFAGLCDVQFSLEGMGDTPLQRIRICWDIICRERPTLIFISGNAYMYALLPLIRKWFPEIVVADILHNEWYNHRDWFNISSEYSRYIDKRVTISEYWRSILVDKYGENRDRVSVFLNSIDLQHFDPGRYVDARHRSLDESDPNCKKIAFIGRLHEQKRPEVFFELAKQFLAVDGYRFVVVGDGTEKSALLNRYSGLKNLVCLGASDDVPGVLATVDLVVFSSVFEGYPLTSLEASAMGVPFIAPDIIGFREQVEDGGGGLLYQASSDECRDAVLIKQLIEQRWDELTKMGGRGRTFVETVHSSSVLEPRYGEFLAGLMRDAGSKRQRAQGSNGGKKLFLHIGIPKTGSTSIQYFMDVNRKHLARQGVLYPKHYMCGYGQHPFAWACMKEGANQNRTFVEYMERYGKSLSQLESDLRVLLETLKRSNSDSVVVSSEAFTRSDPEMVKDLLTGFDVTIIVFLRRQDLYLESSYNQNKKVRPSEVNLNRYLSRNKPTLDYEALLDAWSGCFGKENIVVTPFERNIFSGGLERYFLSLLGVQWNQTYKTELKNPGLNRDCLAFLSEHFLPEEVGDRERGRIIDMLSQYSREHPDDESLKYNLSPATRLEIIEKYREINREVARKYLGREDGVLFLDAPPSLEDNWKPYDGLGDSSRGDIVRYLSDRGIKVVSHTTVPVSAPTRKSIDGKTLYIHIGWHKTGTSYLQSFLLENRGRLSALGVLMPEYAGRATAHHDFASVCFEGDDVTKSFPSNGRKRFSDRREWVADMGAQRNTLLDSSAEKIVLSSERFHNNDPERLDTFFSAFDIKIIVFLRRQDQLLEARVNQLKKVGKITDEGVRRLHESANKNYYRFLSKWSRVFGKENIIVQPYERAQYDGVIERRFLELIGVDWSDDLTPVDPVNTRLSRGCIAFLEKHSQKIKPTKQLRSILEDYTRCYPDEDTIRNFFSPSEHLAILNGCRESNAMVAREFLGRDDGILFYEPEPELEAPWAQYSGLSEAAEARLIGYIKDTGYELPV